MKRTTSLLFTAFFILLPSTVFTTEYQVVILGSHTEIQGEGPVMNNLGQVVGWSLTENREKHAFLYENGKMKDIGTLGGNTSFAQGINDLGHIVGWSLTEEGDQHAFLYKDGTMKDLGTLGGKNSNAYAINNKDQIVGWSQDHEGHKQAFLYENGRMIKLSDYLIDTDKHIKLSIVAATTIKDNGFIIASGDMDGEKKGVLLTPHLTDDIPSTAQHIDASPKEVNFLLKRKKILKLQSYEPTTAGLRVDDNDTGYLDFKISLKYPMFHEGVYEGKNIWLLNVIPFPYFAFTGRFSQYLGSRDSSPVIGKRFNPLLFGRYWLNSNDDYIDIGYGHESNGQSINSEESYYDLRARLEDEGKDPDIADDSLSRGWDYIHFSWKNRSEFDYGDISTYLNLKYFLDYGELQRGAEEYNEWERDTEGKERDEVDGVTLIAKFSPKPTILEYIFPNAISEAIDKIKVAAIYTTGYERMFENITQRYELTLALKNAPPIMIWYSDGYMSDLADYHERVESFGIEFELRNFIENL